MLKIVAISLIVSIVVIHQDFIVYKRSGNCMLLRFRLIDKHNASNNNMIGFFQSKAKITFFSLAKDNPNRNTIFSYLCTVSKIML